MVKEVENNSLNHYEQYPNIYDDESLKIDPIPSKFDESVIVQNNEQEDIQPTFGNVSVTNSTDVHFGNKTFYQGPVTIHNFVYANGDKSNKDQTADFPSVLKRINPETVKDGIDNPGFDEQLTTSVINSFKENSDKVDEVEKLPSSTTKAVKLKTILIQNKLQINTILIFVLAMTLIGVILVVVSRTPDFNLMNSNTNHVSTSEEDHNTPIEAPIDPATSLTPSKLKIVTRLEWLAQPPSHPITPLKTPVPYVIISHTATENCTSQAQCVFQVRYIQTFHLESRGWWDIGYNFLVGGDGEVYVGRGWDKEGSHTFSYNKRSIGISFIGTFNDKVPPKYQLKACQQLIERGVELGYIQDSYALLGARQLQQTKSPGDALYKEIQTWPHWILKPQK